MYIKYDKRERACVLGMPVLPLHVPDDHEGEECAKDHPHGLFVKAVAMDDGMPAENLHIYFSNDGGNYFYNEGEPRYAEHRDLFQRRFLEAKEEVKEDKAAGDEFESSS